MSITLPENYRALTARDLVQQGDQFVSPESGDTVTVGVGSPAIGFPPAYPEQVRRRFHEDNNPLVFRILNEGGERLGGDELLSLGVWTITGLSKIYPRAVTRRRLPQPSYRVLNNCRIADGDERLVDDKWEPVPDHIYGSPADHHEDVIRRPLVLAYRNLTQEDRLQEGDRRVHPDTFFTSIIPADDSFIGETPHPQLVWTRRVANVEQGEGYRLLNSGEAVQEGDEFWSPSAGDWLKSGVGRFVAADADDLIERPFRRALTTKQPTTEPGEGYRLLKVGEPIQSGDEFLSRSSECWVRCSHSLGEVLNPHSPSVRRLIKPTATPILTEREQCFYRLLKVGEVRLPGDEFRTLHTNRWTPCHHCLGEPVRASATPIRRSIAIDNLGPDHRILKAGEVVQPGDEYWLPSASRWVLQESSSGELIEDGDAFWDRDGYWDLKTVREDLHGDEVLSDEEDLVRYSYIRAMDTNILRFIRAFRPERLEGGDKVVGASVDLAAHASVDTSMETSVDTTPAMEEGYHLLGSDEVVRRGDAFMSQRSCPGWNDDLCFSIRRVVKERLAQRSTFIAFRRRAV